MDTRLLDILVCPICKGPLKHDKKAQELICNADKLAYPIRDGIPDHVGRPGARFAGRRSGDADRKLTGRRLYDVYRSHSRAHGVDAPAQQAAGRLGRQADGGAHRRTRGASRRRHASSWRPTMPTSRQRAARTVSTCK